MRPSLPTSASLSPPSASARASLAFGSSPSVRLTVFSEPLCRTVNFTDAFGAIAPILFARSRASFTSLPSTAVMTSPASIPAFCAGLFA